MKTPAEVLAQHECKIHRQSVAESRVPWGPGQIPKAEDQALHQNSNIIV